MLEPSDRLQTVVDRPYTGPQERAKAYEYLKWRHSVGKLAPVIDGTGDPVADYADILGLL